MKSQLMRVVKAGAGAIMLSLCSGCLESDAESEVPAVSALPPVSAVSQVTAPTVQEAPKGPDTVPVLPAVTPEGAAAQPVNGPAGATSPGSTNDFKMVQPVRPPENLKASPVVQEVIKLAEAGVGDEVMMAYVTNSVRAYQLSSDEILYLTDLGVSTEVITAMLQKNGTTETTAPAPAAPPLAMNPATNPGPPAGPANQLPPALTEMPPDQAATAVAQPPQQPVATTTFYSSLAPYGNWVEVPEYGMVWQPTVVVVNPSWRPYGDRGRWMWTDCGWYWYSDYSWGWAPFHYGRWCTHPRLGWVWAPDTTWGPSWVSWRYTSSHCGWAPLPPRAHYRSGFGFSYYSSSVGVSFDFGLTSAHYTFVPANRFHDRNPRQYAVPARQTTTVYHNSVVVNNYVNGNNNTVINRGFGKEPIVRATGRDLQTVNVRQSSAAPLAGRGEQLANNGTTIVAAKPAMQQHGAMRNSLQASRAAAFAPAPAAPAVAGATGSGVRSAGGVSPVAGFSQPRTGGRAQPINLAKADVPPVSRVPGQTATTAPANSTTPNATPAQNGRGPVFTPYGASGSQQRFPANSRPESLNPQNPAINKAIATPTVQRPLAGGSAPSAVQANPFANTPAAGTGANIPNSSGTAPQGTVIPRTADKPAGVRPGFSGIARPNAGLSQSGSAPVTQPSAGVLARNGAGPVDAGRGYQGGRPSTAVTPPYTPRATTTAPMAPSVRSDVPAPARSFSPVAGYSVPAAPSRGAGSGTYSPPSAAPARSYTPPPSSNGGGNSGGGGSTHSSSNGRKGQDK